FQGRNTLTAGDLSNELIRIVKLAKRFDYRGAMNGYGPTAFVLFNVPVAVRQLLNIAVEVEADYLSRAIDDGAAGVAAYGVRRVDEIDGGRKVELRFSFLVSLRQI